MKVNPICGKPDHDVVGAQRIAEQSVSAKRGGAHSRFRSNAAPMPWPCQRSSIDSPNSKLAVFASNP